MGSYLPERSCDTSMEFLKEKLPGASRLVYKRHEPGWVREAMVPKVPLLRTVDMCGNESTGLWCMDPSWLVFFGDVYRPTGSGQLEGSQPPSNTFQTGWQNWFSLIRWLFHKTIFGLRANALAWFANNHIHLKRGMVGNVSTPPPPHWLTNGSRSTDWEKEKNKKVVVRGNKSFRRSQTQ